MKNLLFFILFFLIFSLAYSQESKRYLKLKQNYNYREGYILTLDSVKETGLIKDHVLNEAKKYSVITFVHKDGAKRKYYANGIRGYGFSTNRFVSDFGSFYKVITKGKKVNLYKRLVVNTWSVPGAPGMAPMMHSTSSEQFYVKKKNEIGFNLVKKRNFMKDFSVYFKNCEKVVAKINGKEYKHKDIKKVVSAYNNCE